jgi:uncharacterized protein
MQETTNRLVRRALEPLPPGQIHPAGWLLNQLQIQAEGLTGHLDEFWPDVAESGWIGGTAEGWERGPYWLDGLVPLAFLLQDERLKAKVEHWVDSILERQQEDGWLGPLHDTKYGYEHDPWPVSIALKALTQYQEATADTRIIPALKRFFRRLQEIIVIQPLVSWASMRGADLVLSVYWLFEHIGEDWLLELVHTLQQQSYDWVGHFEHFVYKEKQTSWQHETHVVNTAMALKQPGVWYRLSQSQHHRQAVQMIIETLDTYHGQVTGVFSGDENLAGKNPSQGTELCAVVEYLYSLETLLTIFAEPTLADRWERIAFNALPAPFKPDMWAHQYDQQVNQVICAIAEDRIYTTNRADANIFGLEPDFGCCTANMHQGWPKFVCHLWMRTQDEGLAALSYAPCTIKTSLSGIPVQIEVKTSYPFHETVQMVLSASHPVRFPLLLRVPGWAKGAQVRLGEGEPEAVEPGSFYRLDREWHRPTLLSMDVPMHLQFQKRYHESVSIERGPLVYALKIEEEWKQIRGELPHADWEVSPKSPWNYALKLEKAHPEASCKVLLHPLGAAPFSPEEPPITIQVRGRQIPTWTIEQNAAGPLPVSPVSSVQPLEDLTLLPYGCTNLRIAEFPALDEE